MITNKISPANPNNHWTLSDQFQDPTIPHIIPSGLTFIRRVFGQTISCVTAAGGSFGFIDEKSPTEETFSILPGWKIQWQNVEIFNQILRGGWKRVENLQFQGGIWIPSFLWGWGGWKIANIWRKNTKKRLPSRELIHGTHLGKRKIIDSKGYGLVPRRVYLLILSCWWICCCSFCLIRILPWDLYIHKFRASGMWKKNMCTLSPIIMEVENYLKWKATNILAKL